MERIESENRKAYSLPANPLQKIGSKQPFGVNIVWNDKLESVAKDIGEDATGNKLMHIWEAQNNITKYNRLMMLGICIGPIGGLLSTIGAALNPDRDPTIPIISAIFGFLSGIFVAIIKFGKYDEKSNGHKQAVARYTSVESNVRRQLSLYRMDRIPASTYMEWLERKFEDIFLAAPLLPPKA